VVGFTKLRDFPTTPNALQRQFGGGDSDAFLLAPGGQVVYATFVGGSGADQGDGLELDSNGGAFVAGTTWSNDFPGQPSTRVTSGGDAFVSYFQPDRTGTLRSVVFGGQQQEKLTGIARDERGGLFAVGYTKSKDFPTIHPIQSELRGVSDMFLTRLAVPSLTVTFSTFFGGSGDDSGWGVVVDNRGNPVVAGITNSTDLPTIESSYQRVNKGGLDAFVATFQGADYREVHSTYFGGSKDDSSGNDGDDIKLDAKGNVWLVGLTGSKDLPTMNALQPEYGGGDLDGFLAAFSPDLTKLCHSSYRGGTERDMLEGLDISKSGFVLATGLSWSDDLPMTAKGVQREMSPVNVGGKSVNATLLGLRVGKINVCQR
jgi:Beta-propeller repeat